MLCGAVGQRSRRQQAVSIGSEDLTGLLAVSFPPEFQEKQFVLDVLRQWQFRPAAQDGHAASVEVLLIIPEQPE